MACGTCYSNHARITSTKDIRESVLRLMSCVTVVGCHRSVPRSRDRVSGRPMTEAELEY